MWFAFVLCKTDIYNNTSIIWQSRERVVICFRSLQNWYLQQRKFVVDTYYPSCDLLSFFAKLIFTTTVARDRTKTDQLWFAFVLCKTDIYNNPAVNNANWLPLWFAFVLCKTDIYNNKRKSNCFFTGLWFAFVLCKTDIYNNIMRRIIYPIIVVICFRSLQNWYLQQQFNLAEIPTISCDLLSFFAKLIFTTTKLSNE